jgi:hypothetical protein
MNEDLKAWWFRMPEARLVNHLTNTLKYPPPIVASIVERVKTAREAKRRQRIRDTVHDKQWAELLTPARAELTSVRNVKSQIKKLDEPNAAKWEALSQYEVVLVSVIDRIKKLRQECGGTVANALRELHKETGVKFPNEGEHWTDWVAYSKRKKLQQVFAGLPSPSRGPTMMPFKRKVPKPLFLKQKVALIERLNSELANAEQEYDLATNPEERTRLSELIRRMQRANYLLDSIKPGTPLPSSWQKLSG